MVFGGVSGLRGVGYFGLKRSFSLRLDRGSSGPPPPDKRPTTAGGGVGGLSVGSGGIEDGHPTLFVTERGEAGRRSFRDRKIFDQLGDLKGTGLRG